MPDVHTVKAGEVVTIKPHFKEETVKDSCGVNNGYWACVTHQETFRHNFDKDSHLDTATQHTLVWVCFQHGLEQP